MAENRRLLMLLLIGTALESWAYWYQSTHTSNFAMDWKDIFYPAIRVFLEGGNPYTSYGFYSPVWAMVPLIPFTLLGRNFGAGAWFLFSAVSYVYVAHRLGGRPVAVLAFLLSPLVALSLFCGNIEILVLWGMLMPAPVGLLFVTMKPQVGVAVAMYWAYTTWHEGGWLRTLFTFLPLTAVVILSFILYGNWLGPMGAAAKLPWNMSLFPWSIPIGIVVLGVALVRRKISISAIASLLFSPYATPGSWSISLLSLLGSGSLMVTTTMILWAVFIYKSVAAGG